MRRYRNHLNEDLVEETEEYLKEQDLETWYKKTMPKLYQFIYSRIQNHADTEDVTQETYIRCLKTKHNKTNLPPYPYLRKTAQNLIYDRFRQFKAHFIFPLDLETEDVKTTDDEITTKTLIEELLNNLPQDHRLVLQLRIVEGYSRKETAERMGCSEDAVRGLQYRATQTLRDLMHKGKEG